VKRSKKESKYVSVLTVRYGTIGSLIDMMRYDRCCPATEEDSGKIERVAGYSGLAKPEDHIIRLLKFSANNDGATIGRWRSFNCIVLDERSPEEPPPTTVEIDKSLLKGGIAL
jgi:hypothetical protein